LWGERLKFEHRCFCAMCDNNLVLILTTLQQNQSRLKALISKLETFMGMPEFPHVYSVEEGKEYAEILLALKGLISSIDEALARLPKTFTG